MDIRNKEFTFDKKKKKEIDCSFLTFLIRARTSYSSDNDILFTIAKESRLYFAVSSVSVQVEDDNRVTF